MGSCKMPAHPIPTPSSPLCKPDPSNSLLPQFHVDKKGRVNFAQTELLIHVVNRDTNRILDVDR